MKRVQRHVLELIERMRADDRESGTHTGVLTRPVKCLIVEDDNMDAEMSMLAVGSVGGVEATLARSGDQALAMLADHPDFDIAFIDLKLVGSKAQGTDLIAEIHSRFPRTHIIIITGTLGREATDFLASEAQRGSYVGIVHKPLQAENLDEILNKHRLK